jgi:hypothetical protein
MGKRIETLAFDRIGVKDLGEERGGDLFWQVARVDGYVGAVAKQLSQIYLCGFDWTRFDLISRLSFLCLCSAGAFYSGTSRALLVAARKAVDLFYSF